MSDLKVRPTKRAGKVDSSWFLAQKSAEVRTGTISKSARSSQRLAQVFNNYRCSAIMRSNLSPICGGVSNPDWLSFKGEDEMRRALAIFLVTASLSQPARSQAVTANRVPAAVKKAFQRKFPAVRVVEWKLKSDQNYEAEFTLHRTDIAAKFDLTGKWLETESGVSRSTIPAAVLGTVAKRFNGYKVVETQTVQRWNENRVVYELHLENAKEVVKAQFDEDGTILNQSAKSKSNKAK